MHEPLEASLQGALLAIVHLAYQLPAIWSAYLLARRIGAREFFEFLSLLFFFYLAQMIALPGILGLLRQLPLLFIITCGLAGILTVVERGKERLPFPPFRLSAWEVLLSAVALGFIAYQWRTFSFLPPTGTDSQTYHLYYPAVWLAENRLERLTQPGLVTATYPCYGELIYCWNMAPLHFDFFARHFQFFHILLAFIAAVAAGRAAGFRRVTAIAAGTALVFSSVVFRNAAVANTDIMTGGSLVLGCAFFLIGLRRNRRSHFLLAGVSFGVAAGTKYLGFMLAPPLLLLSVLAAYPRFRRCRRSLLLTLPAAVLAASPCFLANWITYGNPVFPTRIGPLFANYMELPSEAVGWSLRAWHYFVDGQVNSLTAWNAGFLAVGFLGVFFAPRRPVFRRRTGVAFALIWLALLAIQLKIYPAITQPRQIVPLVMLGGMMLMAPFEWIRRRFGVPALAVTLLAIILPEARQQFRHLQLFLSFLSLALIAWGVLRFYSRKRSRRAMAVVAVLLLLAFLPDAGYRHAVGNTAAPAMRMQLLSPEDEQARDLIAKETGGRGAVIAYHGLFFYHYLGEHYENTVATIPVTASGELRLDAYRTLEEMRAPGPPEAWLERLRAAQVQYLVASPPQRRRPESGG